MGYAMKNTSSRARPTSSPKIVSAAGFLARQTTYFLAGDFDAMGDDYEEPLIIIQPFASYIINDRSAFNAQVAIVRNYFLDRGLAEMGMELLVQKALGSDLTSLTVGWIYLDAKGRALGARQATYILRQYDGTFLIAVHIMHTDVTENLRAGRALFP